MNETINTLKQHRSIRRFTDQPIADELFSDLIASGKAASTSSFIQAVSLVRIHDPDSRQALVELSGGQKYIAQAAEFLVFCADLDRNAQRIATLQEADADFAWAEQFLAATVDVALFAQNVVVAAESAGLGCCYIGGIRNDPEQVTALLSLPALVYPVFGLCIGYPDQNPAIKPRLDNDIVVHSERYLCAVKQAAAIDAYDHHVRDYYELRSGGKLSQTWSQQMAKQAASQTRPFMLQYLRSQGFIKK